MEKNIKLYSNQPTSNPDLFRYVNLDGDWQYYFIKSKNLYVPAVNHILTNGFPKGRAFYNYLLSVSKDQADKILEEAGDKGARVHDGIRDAISGQKITLDSMYPNDITGRPEKINMDEWHCLLAFKAFCEAVKPEKVLVEHSVASSAYAGTVDFVGTILIRETPKAEPKRVRVLLDWKSGGGIYDDYKLQTAAYFEALQDPFIEYTGVVRLGTRHKNGGLDNCGYEVKLWNKDETFKHYQAFESALNIFRLNEGEFKPSEVEMPTEIQMIIPQYKAPTPVKKTRVARPKKQINVTKPI